MIENYLARKGVRLSVKGRRWADNVEGVALAIALLVIFGVVGSIESGRWF